MAEAVVTLDKGAGRRGPRLKSVWSHRYLYLMALPGFLTVVIFVYMPLYGLQLAFKQYRLIDGIWGSPWVGLHHFRVLVNSAAFWTVLRNTVEISIGRLVFTFPAPIILALLLNELRNPAFKRMVQSILYLPHFLSWVIMAGIIFNVLSYSTGVVNNVLSEIGLDRIMFLGNARAFRPLLYGSAIWKTAGWGTIIYLAAIAGIDPQLYESAIIDGASRFKRALHITIPTLAYAIVILFILNIGGLLDAGFDQIFNLINPATETVGDIIDTYVYRLGIAEGRFDFTTAVGLFKNVFNCLLLFGANRLVKFFGHEGFI